MNFPELYVKNEVCKVCEGELEFLDKPYLSCTDGFDIKCTNCNERTNISMTRKAEEMYMRRWSGQ